MDIKLQEKIFNKYPEFFEYLKEIPSDSKIIMPMAFGIECNDGWFLILNNLLQNIYNYCKWDNKPFPDIIQIKEKFGRLVVYINNEDEYISGMINNTENLSAHVCEFCGTMEEVGQTEGWIYTTCRSCYEKDERMKNLPFKINEI